MKSQWNDRTAQEMVEAYAAKGVAADIALRVYTTRLLGRDPLLVLHGGGNTSVKTRASDDLGESMTSSPSRAPAPTWPISSRGACPR